jgi:hypothetical protein
MPSAHELYSKVVRSELLGLAVGIPYGDIPTSSFFQHYRDGFLQHFPDGSSCMSLLVGVFPRSLELLGSLSS